MASGRLCTGCLVSAHEVERTRQLCRDEGAVSRHRQGWPAACLRYRRQQDSSHRRGALSVQEGLYPARPRPCRIRQGYLEGVNMTSIVQQAAAHWRFVAPLLNAPETEDDYDALVAALDELLELVGDDEEHPLASLASHMGDLIEEYDDAHRPMPDVRGADMLDRKSV